MIATVLSLWKSPTPNYIINLLFCFYDECLCTCVHVCACVYIAVILIYNSVLKWQHANLKNAARTPRTVTKFAVKTAIDLTKVI